MTNTYAATEKQVSYLESLLRDRDVDSEDADTMRTAINAGIDTKLASQFIGVCLKSPFKARNPNPGQFGNKHANAITEDGMYMIANGTIYKVQFNKAQGDGRRMYAKQLFVDNLGDGTYKVRFEYVKGIVYSLTPADKMSLEQAKEFGALYGTCCNCGRTLTNEESIELGIGPICRAKFA